MFRERPLTWLFIVATICVDLAISLDSRDAFASEWQWGLCLGQSAVLGSWLALGTRHRLERGALFVVGQLLLVIVLSSRYPIGNSPEASGWLLAPNAIWWLLAPNTICGTVAALGAFVGKIVFDRFRETQKANRPSEFRYSLMELLGWTVVVAIAAAALRHAKLLTFLQIPELLFFFLGFNFNIGLITALLADHNNRYRYSISLSLGCTAVLYLIELQFVGVTYPPYVSAYISSMAYVLLWIIICRLDAPTPAHTVPQT